MELAYCKVCPQSHKPAGVCSKDLWWAWGMIVRMVGALRTSVPRPHTHSFSFMTNILSWWTKLFLLLGPPPRSHFPGFINCYHVLTLWATRVLSVWPTSATAVWKQPPEIYKHMGVLCPNKTLKNLAVVCQFLDESTGSQRRAVRKPERQRGANQGAPWDHRT